MKKEKKITKKQIQKLERREIKKKFKEWRLKILKRDKNICVIPGCGATKILHAHHIVARENKHLRFLIDNGITLCPKHHKYSFEISAHRNAFIFMLWFMHNRPEQYERLKLLYELSLKNEK